MAPVEEPTVIDDDLEAVIGNARATAIALVTCATCVALGCHTIGGFCRRSDVS